MPYIFVPMGNNKIIKCDLLCAINPSRSLQISNMFGITIGWINNSKKMELVKFAKK